MCIKSVYLALFIYLQLVQCCRDEQNNLVDWYVLYKLPKQSQHKNPLIQKGLAYTYITSQDKSLNWKLSQIPIDNPKSIPALTLSPFYSNKTQMNILYNDEAPPNNKNEVLGHTKGVVAMNNPKEGFWMVHSVPLYPFLNTYGFPQTGEHFGQSFLCLSLDVATINKVGKQLLYNEPHIYNSKLDVSLREQLPNIQETIDKKFVKMAPWYNINTLNTINGIEFISFAKNRHFGKDIYVDWVAPQLKQNLDVESWLRGTGRIGSDCTKKYTVKNIEQLNMHSADLKFSSENDHSKWAVSVMKNNPWFCVGDINRQEHQKQRGGGTICTDQFPDIWQSYFSLINKTEPCTNNINK